MFCTGRRSIKLWLFLVPALIMLLAGSAQSQSCGDFAAPLGVIDNDDWLYLYAYLYQGGPAPGDLSLGNTDCLGDITSNDLAEIANELFYGDGLSCCPIDANPPFPASSETIEFVNVAPPPWMGGEWTVEVWLWDEVPFWGLSLPFSIEGWPSPVTLLSVDFDIGEYTYYDTDGSSAGLIVMHGLNEPLVGGGRIARLNFWIHGYTNWIHLEPMESYSANHVLGLSTWTGFSVDPVTPNVYEAVPYGCGDFVSPMGPDPDDWITLFEYLYYGGEIMFGPMNMDCIGDITNNDLIELTRALMHGGPLDCCPTEPNPLFSQSTDTIEFREVMVPPGNSTWIVEVWLKAIDDFSGLALPFEFSCPTSPLTLQSVDFHLGGFTAYHTDGSSEGLIGIASWDSPFSFPVDRIASLNFTINPSAETQHISFDPMFDYFPSHTLVLSRIINDDGDIYVDGLRPVVAGALPQASFTKVEMDPADIVQVATADLDLDTRTDVVYVGDSEVGLYVAWGQNADPPIDVGIKQFDVVDATIEIFHINSDTIPDIIAATDDWVYVLLNRGDRSFDLDSVANTAGPPKSPSGGATSYGDFPGGVVGFFDADPYPDLVLSPNKLFSGDGAGGFAAGAALPFSFTAVATSDFNRDGSDDLAVVQGDAIIVYLNDGTGSFTQSDAEGLAMPVYEFSSIAADVDFDSDGYVDVAAVTVSGSESDITLARGDGTGLLAFPDHISVAGAAPEVALSDVNRDYFLDVIVSNSTAGQLQIYFNDGTGGFSETEMEVVDIGAGSDLMFALAGADLDNDGQPDFVSGSAEGENLVLSLNDLPDQPVLDDEMFVTGYDYVGVSVTNPDGYVISRTLQTVAGSDYYRLFVDDDLLSDVRTYDYNVEYGEYQVVAEETPNAPGGAAFTLGIGLDGSQQATVALGYTMPGAKKSAWADPPEPFVFYYTVEETSSIQPENGIPTGDQQPAFDWYGLVFDHPPGELYRFQLNRYHDLSGGPAIYDVAGLEAPGFVPDAPLASDSVYYWRFLTSTDGGFNYVDPSRTFAVYITCCSGQVGDANNSGSDEPTIGDITALIDAKFITGSCDGVIDCIAEADVNQSGGVKPTCDDLTIGDITVLIDYLFVTGKDNWDQGYGPGNLAPCR